MSAGTGRGRPVDTVGAILRRDGAILLGLRSARRRSCPLCWDVIGGHVEPGETAAQALEREVAEEIGVHVAAPHFLQELGYRSRKGKPRVLALFVVERWAGEPWLANDEHAELRWFRPDDAAALPQLALDEYRAVFARLAAPDPPLLCERVEDQPRRPVS